MITTPTFPHQGPYRVNIPSLFLSRAGNQWTIEHFESKDCNSVRGTENTSESFPVWFYLIFDGNLNQTSNYFEHKCRFWTFFWIFLEFHPVKICSVAPMIAGTSKTIKIYSFYLYFLPLSNMMSMQSNDKILFFNLESHSIQQYIEK